MDLCLGTFFFLGCVHRFKFGTIDFEARMGILIWRFERYSQSISKILISLLKQKECRIHFCQ